MTVGAIWREGQHDVRAQSPDLPHEARNHLTGLRLIELPVLVVEQGHVADAEHRGRCAELAFPQGRQRLAPRVLRTVHGVSEIAPTVAPRGGHEARIHSLVGVFREHPAEAQRFVVRVRHNHHQPESCWIGHVSPRRRHAMVTGRATRTIVPRAGAESHDLDTGVLDWNAGFEWRRAIGSPAARATDAPRTAWRRCPRRRSATAPPISCATPL